MVSDAPDLGTQDPIGLLGGDNLYFLQTGSRVIVEASPVDSIWGIGLAQDNADANNSNLWKGLNLLRFALIQVRDGVGV